ncbi:flagellin [Comamonas thiooxydans]|uniref:flagellin N-terminal helical domain-containing protein n=1 Tax=Comamonas thiooxydans TaxID=363952 RepID=UPI00242D4218|nr:flagellin [Comamonas thiooxydans]MDH1253839.1 flagellin [Comamonas thiooxydans]
MAATINTNIASINAQRNLSLSGGSLATSMQRISSGLRINSAKDDAAGLAISERMNTQVRGLTVAARNANDGISLAQTAEGALGKVGDMLQRMRDLAVQAGNSTNSDSDRQALQAEVSQLSAEIDRVAKQTNFNGQKILDGSFAGAVFQVGANSGDNVTLGALADTRSSKMSVVSYAKNVVSFNANDTPTPAIADYASAIPAGTLKISVQTNPAQTIELEGIKGASNSLERLGQVVTAINNKSADTGVTAYMSRNETTGQYDISFMSSKTDVEGTPLAVKFEGFTQATTGIGNPTVSPVKAYTTSPLTSAIPATPADLTTSAANGSAAQALTDITAYRDAMQSINTALGTPAAFDLTALNTAIDKYTTAGAATPTVGADLDAGASDINTALGVLSASLTTNKTAIDTRIATNNALVGVSPSTVLAGLSSTSTVADFDQAIANLTAVGVDLSQFDLSKFKDSADLTKFSTVKGSTVDDALTSLKGLYSKALSGDLDITVQDNHTQEHGLDDIDIGTQQGAWVALKKIDSAIDQINGARATLGAMQSRFENAVNNIDIQTENLSAARGRIVDADFAKETANLSRTQILQQAGTAMVAQANQLPQQVLKLLQG